MKTRDFTIIELLVVISIIVILCSLLLPALRSAKNKAQAIQCSGNMRQVGLGFMSYVNDRNSQLPVGTAISPTGSWCFMIADYVGLRWDETKTFPTSGSAPFYCPTSRRNNYSAAVEATIFYQLSYGYNRAYYDPNFLPSCPYKFIKVKDPALCFLAGELKYLNGAAATAEMDMASLVIYKIGNPNTIGAAYGTYSSFRHSGLSMNVLFMDGHVSAKRTGVDNLPADVYYGDQ